MSENGLSVSTKARLGRNMYSGSEVRSLVVYAGRIGYDLAANVVRNRDDRVKFEEARLRLSRLQVRLLMHTDLVLAELPSDAAPVERMSLEVREQFYWLLGDRSLRVQSMSDEELFEELCRQLRDYR